MRFCPDGHSVQCDIESESFDASQKYTLKVLFKQMIGILYSIQKLVYIGLVFIFETIWLIFEFF